MARQLRLHFASRRSNTDPLSEGFSSHGEERAASLSAHGAEESLEQSSVHLKVTPLSPDFANSQCSSVFIPRVNAGGCHKKNVLQILLQPCGKLGGNLDGNIEDGDPAVVCESGTGSGSDGGSCNSSMASDAGYCSSNSIFEPELPEKHRTNQERTSLRHRVKVPLRRCSSLIIIPKSPCSTPPASPVGSVSLFAHLPPRGSTQSHLQTASRDFPQEEEGVTTTAVSGHQQSKGSYSAELKDTKHMVHFNIPLQNKPVCKTEDRNTMMELSSTPDRSNLHSSSILLHFAHQRPLIPEKGASTMAAVEEAHSPAKNSGRKDNTYKKLYRSTSACLFSSTKSSEKSNKGHSLDIDQLRPDTKHCHRAIQRSFSLEVPYSNTGISCHVSNSKLSSPCSPHVHIHLSPCCPSKLSSSVMDVNKRRKESNAVISSDQNKEVSVMCPEHSLKGCIA